MGVEGKLGGEGREVVERDEEGEYTNRLERRRRRNRQKMRRKKKEK